MNPALRLAIRLTLFLAIIAPLIHLLKIVRISYDVGAMLFYTGFPVIILLLIFGGLWEPDNGEKRGKLLPSLMVVMLITSTIMTFYYGGTVSDIAGNALRLLFAFASIFFLTNSADAYVAFVNVRLFLIAKLGLITATAATLLMHIAALVGFGVYFGLQTTSAFVGLAYGLVYQRFAVVLIALIPLIGSGKRGTMMGALVVLVTYIAMAAGRVRMHRVIALIAALGLTFTLFYVFQLLPATILDRLDFLLTDGDVDLNTATAGRVLEAAAALRHLDSYPGAWLTGFGLGSAINLTEYAGATVSTVHFSPLAMILIFGAPLALVFYSAILYYILAFFRLCRGGRVPREFVVMFLVVVAEFTFSFTAFTILQSYLLWMALAYLIASKQSFRCEPAAKVAFAAPRSMRQS